METWQILLFVSLLTGSGISQKYQIPRPYRPGNPVLYPEDYCESTFVDGEAFDFIVVGSGPAGSVVARRLAEVPSNRVLLLEAGDDPPALSDIPTRAVDLGLELRWVIPAVKNPNVCQGILGGVCLIAPGKVLGGSSIVNYMMYVRGNPFDYEEWAAMGNPGWSYREVLPYFQKLENYMATPLIKGGEVLFNPLDVQASGNIGFGENSGSFDNLEMTNSIIEQASSDIVSEQSAPLSEAVLAEDELLQSNSIAVPLTSVPSSTVVSSSTASASASSTSTVTASTSSTSSASSASSSASSTSSASLSTSSPAATSASASAAASASAVDSSAASASAAASSAATSSSSSEPLVRRRRTTPNEILSGSPGSFKPIIPYQFDTASTTYHSIGGPMTAGAPQLDPQTVQVREAIVEAAGAYGIKRNPDVNSGYQMGIGNIPGLIDTLGYRDNSAKAYLLNIPDNLKVCKNALVRKVNMEGLRAVGVEFEHKEKDSLIPRTLNARATKETILSAGPIQSPALLERSGIGRSEVLEKAKVKLVKELKGVGENFYDHFVNIGCAFKMDYNTQAMMNPLSLELTSLTAFLNTEDPTSSVPDLQYILKTYVPKIALGLAFKPDIAIQFNNSGPNLLIFGTVILRQGSPGSIHILQSGDPNLPPAFMDNQLSTQRDIDLTVKGVRLARKIMKHEAMAKFKPEPVVLEECKHHPFNSVEEIMCEARYMASSLYHQTTTCSMGPASNPKSVVDHELRVHGIERLRVIDSSIMPLPPRGNTEVPTLMVGEKGADLVKKAWGQA